MKKMLFLVMVLLVAGITLVAAQSNQPLSVGQVYTGQLNPGAVHTFVIRLGNDAEYFIAWDDVDTGYADLNYADIVVGVRGDGWGQYMVDVQDYGNHDRNLHKLATQNSGKRNPLNPSGTSFSANTQYIVEVRGLGDSSSGQYRIVFY